MNFFRLHIKVWLLISCILYGIGSALAQKCDEIIPIKDGQLHYQIYGEGDPLLIINGGPGMSSKGFIPLAKELAKTHQVILYDQRGTGLSTLKKLNSKTIHLDAMLKDIETLRNHLQIKSWIVLGHSFGGMLAYYYASKHPQYIKAMIQSSSGGMDLSLLENLNITQSLSPTERDSLNFYNHKITQGDTTYLTAYNRGRFLAPAYVYNKKHVLVVAKRLTQGNRQVNSLVWQNMRNMPFNTTSFLKNFKKPVLIIHGKNDVVGIKIPELAHATLPNSKLVLLDKCKHYGWLDRKDAYFKEIKNYLNTICFE